MRHFGISKGVISRAIVRFSSPPEPHPLTVCFHFPGTFLTHKYVLESVRNKLQSVSEARVAVIQFVDRNTIHGTRGSHTSISRLVVRYNALLIIVMSVYRAVKLALQFRFAYMSFEHFFLSRHFRFQYSSLCLCPLRQLYELLSEIKTVFLHFYIGINYSLVTPLCLHLALLICGRDLSRGFVYKNTNHFYLF